MAGALSGIRVLDLGRFVACPFGGMLLADMGADVIRVERPRGSEDRYLGFLTPVGYSYLFVNHNRNKRAITLNFEKNDKAKQVLFELAKQSDIIIHNFSPTATKGIGLTYDNFKKAKSDIIVMQVSAFGTNGPYKNRIGFDRQMKAMSGAMAISGFTGTPVREQPTHIDYITGCLIAFGVVSALYHRDKTGEGQLIDTALLQNAIAVMAPFIGEWETAKKLRLQMGNRLHFVGPSDLYKTKDERWVFLDLITNAIWNRFCKYINREDLLRDNRFQNDYDRWEHRDIIDPIVTDWVASQTAEEVIIAAEKIPIPAGLSYYQSEVAHDPQVKAEGMLSEVPFPDDSGKLTITSPLLKMSATPNIIYRTFPVVGQHNEEVYGKLLGYGKELLAKLAAEGII